MAESPLDYYNLRARLAPILFVIIPLGFACASWFSPGKKLEGTITGTALALVLSVLLSQLGRDAGKRKQQYLFTRWGGTPTTRILAYQTTSLNHYTLMRCHQKLRQLQPTLPLPKTKQEEEANWPQAAQAYESAVDYLREATRNKDHFPLVIEENTNFGCRRNLWAMKPTGITLSILGLVACTARTAQSQLTDQTAVIGIIACLALLMLWITRFTPGWVKTAAEEYAKQLISACDKLETPNKASAKTKIQCA